MTAKEMKTKVFSLIEEYYPTATLLAEDEDVIYKVNGVINQIQMDLMQYRKINAVTEIEISESDDKEINLKNYIDDLYQLNNIWFNKHVDYEMPNAETIILPEDYTGTFKVYYFKYPELMKLTFASDEESANYDARYEFELDNDALEVAPYGIAADLLKMDMISNYGRYFYERYNEMKNVLMLYGKKPSIQIAGGYDI